MLTSALISLVFGAGILSQPNPVYRSQSQPVAGGAELVTVFARVNDPAVDDRALTRIWPKNLPTNATVPDFASTPFASPTAAHGHVYVPTFALCALVNGNCLGGNNYTQAGVLAYF